MKRISVCGETPGAQRAQVMMQITNMPALLQPGSSSGPCSPGTGWLPGRFPREREQRRARQGSLLGHKPLPHQRGRKSTCRPGVLLYWDQEQGLFWAESLLVNLKPKSRNLSTGGENGGGANGQLSRNQPEALKQRSLGEARPG